MLRGLTLEGEDGLRLLAKFQYSLKLLERFTERYKGASLTAEYVKEEVNKTAGAEGAIHYLEMLLFGQKTEGVALALVGDDSLSIRLDVYLAAGRALKPELRNTYGFTKVELFDRLGSDTYWHYLAKSAERQ